MANGCGVSEVKHGERDGHKLSSISYWVLEQVWVRAFAFAFG